MAEYLNWAQTEEARKAFNKGIIETLVIKANRLHKIKTGVLQGPLRQALYLFRQGLREYESVAQNNMFFKTDGQIRNNWHLSQAAYDLWNTITTDNISKFSYDELITCDKITTPISLNYYKGNSSAFITKQIKPFQKIQFNRYFHTEHTIEISYIANKIFKYIEENGFITFDVMEDILESSIHITIMLKEEDRRFSEKEKHIFYWQNNPDKEFNDIVKNVYNKYGINLIY